MTSECRPHQVREMLSQCGASRAGFVSHSFGTAVLAAILKKAPEVAVAFTMVDPICFQLHTSAIVSNFLLAEPVFSHKTFGDNWVHYAQKMGATLELSLQVHAGDLPLSASLMHAECLPHCMLSASLIACSSPHCMLSAFLIAC